MKKLLLPIISLFFGTTLMFSQPMSNFIFFSEDGLPFQLIMNGIQENQNPQTNVKVTGLSATNYKVKIVFEDKTIPSIEKNIYTKSDIEITYAIKKNNKGVNVMRYYSEAPISYQDVVVEKVYIVEEPVYNNTVQSEGVHIDMNVNESGVNYNMTTDEGSVSINANINVSGTNINYDADIQEYDVEYVEDHTYVENNSHVETYHMPGYSGQVGCPWPMKTQDFQRAKSSILKADFDDDKITIAKQVINTNCLTTEQVKDLVGLFTFEDDKLDFAKYAYSRTFDIGNYFIINDAFEFSSSISELNDYINSFRW